MLEYNEKKIQISPSLICLDMLNLKAQIDELQSNGIDMLHIDIIDGHFSQSMPLGFETVRQVRQYTDMYLECHVMTENPEYFISELIDIGVDQIVFHIETARHVDGLLNKIHASGIRCGVALKPSTPLAELEYIAGKCDVVLLMLINPGYASDKNEGQIPYGARKIEDLIALKNRLGVDFQIELDGRISIENVMEYSQKGVEIFVGGTTCINKLHITESLKEIQNKMKE